MEELKEENRVYIGGKGKLEATVAGTRKYQTRRTTAEEYAETGKLLITELVDPGEIVAVHETDNIICNEGLLLYAGFIRDESGVYDVGIVHCEIGTGDTAPAAGDIILTAFSHRNTVTNDSRAAYEVTFATFFTKTESDVNIKEAGVWGGGDSNPDVGGQASGLLFAHWLAAFDNRAGLYDITITYILTVARG